MNQPNLVIRETDGALTCLWKAMYGKGWQTAKTIIGDLEACHYTPSMLRVKLSQAPETLIIKRRMDAAKGGRALIMEYCIVEGSVPPEEVAKPTKKQRGILPVEATSAQKEASGNLMSIWHNAVK